MAPEGRRLSKRDADLDLGAIRQRMSAERLLGVLANAAGLVDRPDPISAVELASVFSWEKIRGTEIVVNHIDQLY